MFVMGVVFKLHIGVCTKCISSIMLLSNNLLRDYIYRRLDKYEIELINDIVSTILHAMIVFARFI